MGSGNASSPRGNDYQESQIMKRYCGVGSRETPPEVLSQMKTLANFLAQYGWLLRSGGAQGADTAFETGCGDGRGSKEIFLPWKRFNGNLSPLYTQSTEAIEMARDIHPCWNACRFAAKKMHARNVHQVLGKDLVEPVDLVVCWTKRGKVTGGTATAINLAKSRGIPVFNMYSGFYFPKGASK